MNRYLIPWALALLVLDSPRAGAQGQDGPEARVRVEQVAGGTILVREVVGDYAQHSRRFWHGS